VNAFLLDTAWAIGGSLPAVAWKILCIHAVAAGLLALARPCDNRLRYALLCASLIACVAMLAVDVTAAWRALPAAGNSTHAQAFAAPAAATWPLWLALAWLVGSLVASLRVLLGIGWLRSQLRRSQVWADPAWQARAADLSRRLGLARGVSLRVAHHLATPVTAGWLKPVVLMPATLVTGMPADLLEALLVHELAHVRRHDYLVNLLQHAAEALLFFHPSVWWLSRRLRIERERIADAMAASVLPSPLTLARALHGLSDAPRPPAAVAPGARDGDLLDRIRRLAAPASVPARRTAAGPILAMTLALTGFIAWPALQAARPGQAPTATEARHILAQLPGVQALIASSGATHVLLQDDTSGATLLGRAENDAVPIASLTKLMTAMVVLDTAPDLDRRIVIDEQDAQATAASASALPVGTATTLDTLLKLALMSSDNRAAHALARSYPGGETAFRIALQRKTAALHLQHTTLEEPTGLSGANRASAVDIGKIMAAASAYPQIARDTTALAETVATAGASLHYRNTNPLVGARGWDIRLSKTGASTEAGRCLAMRLHIDDRDLTLVLLNGRAPAA
jgi:D-alanyl-D-alanine endopeptidase (penicillin-binding protein 7)